MEYGENTRIPNVGTIKKGDLDISVSAGLIMRGSLGDAIKIRQLVEDSFGPRALVYTTISSSPLFLVKFKDLSNEKQNKLNSRQKGY